MSGLTCIHGCRLTQVPEAHPDPGGSPSERVASEGTSILQPWGCSVDAAVCACAGGPSAGRAGRPRARQLSEAIPYLDDGFSPDWTSNLPGQTYTNTFYVSPVGPCWLHVTQMCSRSAGS